MKKNKSNIPEVVIPPIIEEPKIDPVVEDMKDPELKPIPEPEPVLKEQVITPSDNLINDDINNIKATNDIEKIVEDETIKKNTNYSRTRYSRNN